jgi:NAD(P)-dependent dehydrogenase (short-subunit alcohol dehydrogenase family)
VPGDVRSWRDVASLVSQARSTFGGLDVMVANAAVSIYAEFEQIGEEDLDIILDTNLRRAT